MTKIKSISYSPLPGYVLVRPLKGQDSERYVVVDEQFPQLAEVLKVGDPVMRDYTDTLVSSPVKVGQTIVHSSFGFEKFRHEGEELRIVPFNKILLVHK